MAWTVEINGKRLPESFATEDEANQAVANLRANDWEMKVVVTDDSAEGRARAAAAAAPPQPKPATTVLDEMQKPPSFQGGQSKYK